MTPRCQRCKRKYRGRGEWNAVFAKGVVVAFLCPTCQAPEENAEAVINEATIDYSKATTDNFGRLVAPTIGATR
ncbi:hypothetical protein ACTHAM_002397 [Cellulomonas soli]|uniref:hypothetical protein n=1 Tax=Cellulomonas soli TaxID=931535 RepID=UPI003F842E60